MKYILASLFFISAFSCNRNNSGLSGNDTEISFDMNGQHYTYKGEAQTSSDIGVYGYKKFDTNSSLRHTVYEFDGNKSGDNHIYILAYPDSLKTQTYTSAYINGTIINTAQIRIIINGKEYTVNGGNNNHFELQITSYKNGVVNAVFAGNVSQSQLNIPSVTITNGIIKDVNLHYK